MAIYIPIADAEIAAESPVTVSLMTRLRDNALSYLGAPTGTTMLVRQASAPVGWTFDNTHNDKALRIVNNGVGTGGTASFATVFGTNITGGRAITVAQMPAHAHDVSDPTHSHSLPFVAVQDGGNNVIVNGGTQLTTRIVSTALPSSGTNFSGTGISLNNNGGGQVHDHPIELRVQYVDFRIVVKD